MDRIGINTITAYLTRTRRVSQEQIEWVGGCKKTAEPRLEVPSVSACQASKQLASQPASTQVVREYVLVVGYAVRIRVAQVRFLVLPDYILLFASASE